MSVATAVLLIVVGGLIGYLVGGVLIPRLSSRHRERAAEQTGLTMSQVLDLKVGDTLMLNATPDSEISVRAGAIPLTVGRMGRKGQHIAVRVEAPINVEAASSLTKGKR